MPSNSTPGQVFNWSKSRLSVADPLPVDHVADGQYKLDNQGHQEERGRQTAAGGGTLKLRLGRRHRKTSLERLDTLNESLKLSLNI